MGISIQEILAVEYFNDFEVIAGRKGMHREIQGIASLEAPDCFKWAKGRELVLSSGYVISREPDCIAKAFEEGDIQQIAGLVIKKDRHLKEVPQPIIDLFNRYSIPLIIAPFYASWMDISNNVNISVMNRAIQRFRRGMNNISPTNVSYKEKQIKSMLKALETELNFPAYLYDIRDKESYYSSRYFEKTAEGLGLNGIDYRNPPGLHTKSALCDYIKMTRIRLIDPANADSTPISWVVIPISVNNVELAYFVVMESRELLDYYDEYSIRIAYLMIQSIYEQSIDFQNAGNVGFENFINYAMNCPEYEARNINLRAASLGISTGSMFSVIIFHKTTDIENIEENRQIMREAFYQSRLSKFSRIAFLGDDYGIILAESSKENDRQIKDGINDILNNSLIRNLNINLYFGISDDKRTVSELKPLVEKCRKVISIGRMFYPNEKILDYDSLGALTWLDVPEEELKLLMKQFDEFLSNESGRELLKTLKCYLENNMNFSATSKEMYVHINTIRTRIEKINDMIDIGLSNHIEQVKLLLLLQFIEL